jgi:hypothetical protein
LPTSSPASVRSTASNRRSARAAASRWIARHVRAALARRWPPGARGRSRGIGRAGAWLRPASHLAAPRNRDSVFVARFCEAVPANITQGQWPTALRVNQSTFWDARHGANRGKVHQREGAKLRQARCLPGAKAILEIRSPPITDAVADRRDIMTGAVTMGRYPTPAAAATRLGLLPGPFHVPFS